MAPAKKRRRRRKWIVSLSAAELCVSNAERLLVDASKTSPPTSAALAELSIEEIAKGWMLYFRLLFQGRKTRFGIRLTRAETQQLESFFEKHSEYLKNLDEETLAAFERHRVKLRFLAFLLDYIRQTLPIVAKKGRLRRFAEAIQGPAFKVGELAPENVDGILKVIEGFRLEGLTELDQVKQQGFYVDLTDSGDLISPDIQFLPAPLLGSLAAVLILMLKADLVAFTK